MAQDWPAEGCDSASKCRYGCVTVLGELNGAVPKGSLDGYLRQHLA